MGGGQDVKRKGVYKGEKISRKRDPKKEKRIESRTRTEREESE